MVRFSYFSKAIARSTAVSLDLLFEAAEDGKALEVDAIAIKGRPFQEWTQDDDNGVKWGYGKVCLATEQ